MIKNNNCNVIKEHIDTQCNYALAESNDLIYMRTNNINISFEMDTELFGCCLGTSWKLSGNLLCIQKLQNYSWKIEIFI